jgi:tRNA (cmo5U34)-methyltransferase
MPKFTFAAENEGFDKHIQLSIRGYNDLWSDVLKFSEYFIEDGTTVVDIGCSTGKLLKAMKKQNDGHAPDCIYKGIEIEEDFYSNLLDNDNLEFYKMDVRGFDWDSVAKNCSLITSIFTLQFIPKRDRSAMIGQIFNALSVGGAFIFAEKLLSTDAQIEEMVTFCYYDWKRQHFTEKEILDKEGELRYMMKLFTEEQTMTLLKDGGFSNVQRFWQNFNFVGWIAIRNDE